MRDFKNLKVWEKSHHLTLDVYKITRGFPQEERFGLTSQVRRSAASVPANIAEGCGRHSTAELARFCDIASGSASETHYHFVLAHDLGYLTHEVFLKLEQQTNEVKRMLNSFTKTLRR